MSRYIHYAIVVTDLEKDIEKVYLEVSKLIEQRTPEFLKLLTPIFSGLANSYYSFSILPSGLSYNSKEIMLRKEICDYLHTSEAEFIFAEFGLELNRPAAINDSDTRIYFEGK